MLWVTCLLNHSLKNVPTFCFLNIKKFQQCEQDRWMCKIILVSTNKCWITTPTYNICGNVTGKEPPSFNRTSAALGDLGKQNKHSFSIYFSMSCMEETISSLKSFPYLNIAQKNCTCFPFD